MERMKRVSESAHNGPKSTVADEDDILVIEDEENAVEEPIGAGECSPEEYIKAHMDPNCEMVEVYDEVDGKFYKVPAFETGVDDNAKTEEQIVAEANSWEVTASIIAGITLFIALVFWLCFALIV